MAGQTAIVELASLGRRHAWQLAVTYGLFNVENLVRIVQPLLIGWAINDLLAGSTRGLLVYAGAHGLWLVLRAGRQMYDTRAFTAIYTDRVCQLVAQQRPATRDVSPLAARCRLARTVIDFLERDVPLAMRSIYSVVGALVLLSYYDLPLAGACLVLALPAGVLHYRYGCRVLRYSRRLHDQLEREVFVINRAEREQVQHHFNRLAQWQVRLSDAEAWATAIMEVFVLALLAGGLWRITHVAGSSVGDVFAVFRYVLMFVAGLDAVPMLVQQVSRLRDIARRMQSAEPATLDGLPAA